MQVESLIIAINRIIWGWPLIATILAVGGYFSFKLGMLRFSRLKLAIKYIIKENSGEGEISVFAALCTALSATIGTGNIVGIAVAITLGGPGALFWLWVSSIVSFSIKYAEGLLAIKYRVIGKDGKISGGPMYYIELGLKHKKYAKILAKMFAVAGIMVALVGIGTLSQSNSIAVALSSFGLPSFVTAIFIVSCVAAVTLGGLRRIATVSEKIVPTMTVFYIGVTIILLVMNFKALPHVFSMIFQGAFFPEAILGGGIGITVMHVVSIGVSRGIFSHESGLGSSAIAEATAKTDSPVKQGFTSMSGAMLSVIVCTMTGLVLIITSNETGIFSAHHLEGSQLTSYAFSCGLGSAMLGKYVVGIGIILFAFTTIIGWNYYGEKCTQYVFGNKAVMPYNLLFLFFVAIGPFFKIDIIFTLADIVTGLMAIPNLIGLIGLRKVIVGETKSFFGNL